MKVRKLLSFVLVLAMVLSTGIVTAFAADTLEIQADSLSVTRNVGDTLSIDVNATTDVGFALGQIEVGWDKEQLELKALDNASFSVAPAYSLAPMTNSGTYKVGFGDPYATENYNGPGRLFTLTFEVLNTSTNGEKAITLKVNSLLDVYGLPVNKSISDTSITLQGPSRSVTFNMGGHGTQVTAQTVEDGSTATEPTPAPAEDGWTFKGWFEADLTTAFNFSSPITADTVVYAKWAQKGAATAEDFTFTPSSFVYDGTTKSVTVNWKDGTGTGYIYKVIYDPADPVDAGMYDILVSAEGDTNYNAVSNLNIGSFAITPKTVNVTGATVVDRDYVAGDSSVEVTDVTFDDAGITASDYTATATMTDANAGTAKAVNVTVELKSSVKNYTLGTATCATTVDIDKIDLPSSVKTSDSMTVRTGSAAAQTYTLSALPADAAGASYGDATATTNTDGLVTGTPAVSGTTLSFNADTSLEAGKTAQITVTINGGTNYNDGTFVLTANLLDKDDAAVTVDPAAPVKTFGDDPFVITATAANEGENGAWTWESDNEAVAKVEGGTVTIMGQGTATIKATYESDTTAGNATASLTVNKATPTVTAPNPLTGLKYDGNPKELVGAGSTTGGELQYSLDGSTYSTEIPKGTKADDYTVYYRVVGGDNYNDVAADTVGVSIAKAVPVVEPVTVTAPATIYSSTAKDAITLSTGCTVAGTLTVEGFSATNKVVSWKFTPTDTANYEVAEGYMSVDVVEVALDKIEITTQPTKTTGYLYDDAGEFDYTGAVVTATYNNGDTKVLDNVNEVVWSWTWGVGTVTVTATYEGKTDTVDITVEKATPTITAEDVEMVYTGSAAADSLISGTAVDASGNEVIGEFSFKSGQDVTKVADSGTKTVVFTPSDDECYNSVEETVTLTITAKSVTVSGLTADNKEYDGTNTASVSGTPVLEGKVEGDDLDFTAGTPTFSDAEAGNNKQITLTGFSLTGADAGNYTLEDPASLTANITPKAITISGATLTSRDYAKGNKDVEVSAVTFDGPVATLAMGTDFTATAAMADDNAGTDKAATVTVTLTNTNYSLATKTYEGTVTINKIAWAESTAVAGEAKFGAEGTAQIAKYIADGATVGTATITGGTAAAIEDGTLSADASALTWTFSDSATAGDTVTVSIPVTGATNYNDYTLTATLTVLAKNAQSLDFSELSKSVDYGKTLTFAATHGTGDGAVTYSSSDESVATVNDSGKVTPVAPGTATITATAAETDDYAEATATYSLTVNKAALTITAKSFTITVGQEAPTLTGTEYTVTGLVGSDSVDSATVAYASTPDTSAAGTVAINVSAATGTGLANYDITYVAGTLTIRAAGGNGGGGGSESTSSATDNVVPATADANGNLTATVSAAQAASGQTLKLSQSVKAAADSASAPTIKIDVPDNAGKVKIDIPVENVSPKDAVILVNPDGTEQVIPNAELTEDGLVIEVDKDVTVKVVRSNKKFVDVPDNYWAAKAIDFVVARGLFAGTTETTFSPTAPMTRGMLATVLYRLESKPKAAGKADFSDVFEGLWCKEAIDWATSTGVVAGYGDSFGVNDPITREQLAAMLWRLAGKPAAKAVDTGCSDYAKDAMSWAVATGILQGDGAGNYNPKSQATRAEVAAMLMRFIER